VARAIYIRPRREFKAQTPPEAPAFVFKLVFGEQIAAWIHDAFPLILTFSRREKEQPLIHFLKFTDHLTEFRRSLAKKNWERYSLSRRERDGVRGT
jgi:hypothetical protein